MINKVFEILINGELRSWLKFKIFHPRDKFVDEYREQNHFSNSLLSIKNTPSWLTDIQPLAFSVIPFTKIRLASQVVSREEFLELIKNNGKGLFGEDVEALYRFNGILLLSLNNELDESFLQSAIADWIDNYSEIPIAMSSYVISERLANLGIILSRSKIYERWEQPFRNRFHSAVERDVRHLAKNLEYFGERLTGNHLSNNARGLLWGAYLNGNSELSLFSAKMLVQESFRILEDCGLLREGSSHYQSLIARNFLEGWILTGDEKLKEIAQKTVSAIHIVKPQGCELYIGDISPDFPIDYFKNIAHYFNTEGIEEVSTGWMSHFKKKIYKKDISKNILTPSFCHISKNDICLTAHYNQEGSPLLAGHAHCDTGSFTIVKSGKEILIDRGRLNYNFRDDDYIGPHSHNTVEINGTYNEILRRGVYGPLYLKSISAEPEMSLIEDGLNIKTKWKKFSLVHTRSVTIENNAVLIEDRFIGTGNHRIVLNFNFATKDQAQKVTSMNSEIEFHCVKRALDYGIESVAYQVKVDLGIIRVPHLQTTKIDCN